MERAIIWTNELNERNKADALKALADGKAVSIQSDSIGHTRAEAVRWEGDRFLKSTGATPADTDEFGNKYYKK